MSNDVKVMYFNINNSASDISSLQGIFENFIHLMTYSQNFHKIYDYNEQNISFFFNYGFWLHFKN